MIYAEIKELEAGWRELAPDEVSRAETLLARASLFLDEIVEKYNIDATSKADALSVVCCDLVQRKMEAASALPIASYTETAGAFSETTSFQRKRKSWELYPEDLALLGVRNSKGGMVKIAIHNAEGDDIAW